jgi:hypothetical protein
MRSFKDAGGVCWRRSSRQMRCFLMPHRPYGGVWVVVS